MKLRLRITKTGAPLFAGTFEIEDAESFGKACAEAWLRLEQQRMNAATSVGALYEGFSDTMIDLLNGAHIELEKA